MKRSDLMRGHLSDALLNMSSSHKLSDIKVKDLVKEAGVSRQTFYNHFSDINDLICYTATRPLISDASVSPSSPQNYSRIFDAAREHPDFYRQLPKQEGQNTFRNAYVTWAKDMWDKRIPDELPATEREALIAEISIFCEGSTNLLMDFFASDMSTPNDDLNKWFFKAMPQFMIDNPFPAGTDIGYPT